MGPIGLFANIVLLLWTAFTLVMYSFPSIQPVTAGDMNYVSAVYGVVTSIVVIYWFARGKRTYRNRDERHVEAAALEDEVIR